MGSLEHRFEISAKIAPEQKLRNKKNAILASAKGSAHASFTVLTVNVLGSFFHFENVLLDVLEYFQRSFANLNISSHLTEQNFFGN